MRYFELITEEKIVQTAFRSPAGEIFPSGPIHDIDPILKTLDFDSLQQKLDFMDQCDPGFLTDQGRFLTRKEAAEITKLKSAKYLDSLNVPFDDTEARQMRQRRKMEIIDNEF